MTFERITVDAGQMGGMPCLRGLRIPVATSRTLNRHALLIANWLDRRAAVVAACYGLGVAE